MKRYAVVLAALVAIAAVPAMAQTCVGNPNYHYGAAMNCSDCHSMHASAHLNMTTGAAITTPNLTGGTAINPYYPAPNPGPGRAFLLKNDDVCASCHDGQTFAPDVIGANTNNTYARSAGKIGTATQPIGGGHVIGNMNVPPGYDDNLVGYYSSVPATGLECVNCHSPHGSGNFRNLVPYQMRYSGPGVARTGYSAAFAPLYNKTAFSNTQDVIISNNPDFSAGGSTFSAYYGRDAVTYTKLAAPVTANTIVSSNRMDVFCGACHGAFHGGAVTVGQNVGNGTDFVRHPTSTVSITSVPTYAGQAIAQANLRVYQTAAASNLLTDSPGCLTCHRAHGSANPFGLVYPNVTAAEANTEAGESGTGVYKNLCKTCHSMGGTF